MDQAFVAKLKFRRDAVTETQRRSALVRLDLTRLPFVYPSQVLTNVILSIAVVVVGMKYARSIGTNVVPVCVTERFVPVIAEFCEF